MPTRPRPPSIGSGNHRSRTLFLFTSRNSRRVSDGSLRRETRIAFRMPWLACFARRVSRLIDVVAIDVNHKTRAVNQPCATSFWPLRSNSRPFFFPAAEPGTHPFCGARGSALTSGIPLPTHGVLHAHRLDVESGVGLQNVVWSPFCFKVTVNGKLFQGLARSRPKRNRFSLVFPPLYRPTGVTSFTENENRRLQCFAGQCSLLQTTSCCPRCTRTTWHRETKTLAITSTWIPTTTNVGQ